MCVKISWMLEPQPSRATPQCSLLILKPYFFPYSFWEILMDRPYWKPFYPLIWKPYSALFVNLILHYLKMQKGTAWAKIRKFWMVNWIHFFRFCKHSWVMNWMNISQFHNIWWGDQTRLNSTEINERERGREGGGEGEGEGRGRGREGERERERGRERGREGEKERRREGEKKRRREEKEGERGREGEGERATSQPPVPPHSPNPRTY